MAEHVIVNVEAQVVRAIWDEAERIEAQASGIGDPAARALLIERAEATRRAARIAVARAESLDSDVSPADIEPVSKAPLTTEEEKERAEMATAFAERAMIDERNARLAASDWTQLPDAPVDKDAWATYRQELRDLPSTVKDVTAIVWPVTPGEPTRALPAAEASGTEAQTEPPGS